MKISVLGAGAVGSMLGGLIKHRHPDVEMVFIARGQHGRAMHRLGRVRLIGPWGTHDVPAAATEDVGEIAGSDIVVLAVKSQDTAEAIAAAAPWLGKSVVVSVQNGINDSLLRRHVAGERLVMGMTAANVAVVEPGCVSLQLAGATVVGPDPLGANARASRMAAALLRKTGLEVLEHANVLGVRYNKLAINVLGYAACLSASNFITEAVCDGAWRRHVGLPLLAECIATFAAAGIELAKIAGRPDAGSLRRLLRLLDVPLIGTGVALGAKRIYNRKPILFSLYQDLLRGKPTETDHISGHIVRLARAHGRDAPLNALAVALCHRLEARGPARFYRKSQVIERFARAASAAPEFATGAVRATRPSVISRV